MGKILLISTPEEGNCSRIALVEEPWEGIQNREDKIQYFKSIADWFWDLVWGIVWNGIIQNDYDDWRPCFSVQLPNRNLDYSPIDSKSFPWNWDNVRRQAYIMEQVHRIMKYGATNPLYLSKWNNWSELKSKNHTTIRNKTLIKNWQ